MSVTRTINDGFVGTKFFDSLVYFENESDGQEMVSLNQARIEGVSDEKCGMRISLTLE